jgi:hypothetical protein
MSQTPAQRTSMADQFVAKLKSVQENVIPSMQKLISQSSNIEVDLFDLARLWSTKSAEEPQFRDGIVAGYVIVLYMLSMEPYDLPGFE